MTEFTVNFMDRIPYTTSVAIGYIHGYIRFPASTVVLRQTRSESCPASAVVRCVSDSRSYSTTRMVICSSLSITIG